MENRIKSILRRTLFFVVWFGGALALMRALSPTHTAHNLWQLVAAAILASGLVFFGIARQRI